VSKVLLDTSAFIAGVDGELDLASLPGEATISAVTLCELHYGILVASEVERPRRLLSLDIARSNFDALPVDDRIAPKYGELVAMARRAGKGRPPVADTLIAATAMAYGLPLLTLDKDFEVESFKGVEIASL
jgi:predicted nucleic acid-binding protein